MTNYFSFNFYYLCVCERLKYFFILSCVQVRMTRQTKL